MSAPRIYYPEPLTLGNTFTLSHHQAHHLINVLRIKSGTHLILFNDDGSEYEAEFKVSQKNEIAVTILNYRATTVESQLSIHLGQSITRSDKMDFSVQKAVELGVSAITPISTEFCCVKLSKERQEKKIAHWKNIAIHATEQCGRVRVPTLNNPNDFMEWITLPHKGLKLIAHHKGIYPFPNTQHTPNYCAILIGPEGGFSGSEVNLAKQHGFQLISLGPRVLRAETATIVALTLLQTQWGDVK